IQVFLTWELAIESADVARALQIEFDVEPSTALQQEEEQLLLNGEPAMVCPQSGRWHRMD
ncbi:MAG TPA: hypothetical protein VL522_23420, partial [Bordetella sp.]|nr:hypothetical protein [Bordetella sp.]